MELATKPADVGVIVGRFQVDRIHPGHAELINFVRTRHNKMIIVLGIPVAPNRDNPLDYEARMHMIREACHTALVIPIRDCRSDEQWSSNLDAAINNLLSPGQTACLYGCRESFIDHYTGKFPTCPVKGSAEHWSGTQIREDLRTRVYPSADFRAGVIWGAANAYRKVFPTVDIAIYKKTNVGLEMLMARKPDSPLWRFIGGFADPGSPSYEDDARREAFEETGLDTDYPVYIGSTTIADWRYRGEDKIKTLFFRAKYISGAPRALDDLDGGEVAFHKVCDLHDKIIIPEHNALWHMWLKEQMTNGATL